MSKKIFGWVGLCASITILVLALYALLGNVVIETSKTTEYSIGTLPTIQDQIKELSQGTENSAGEIIKSPYDFGKTIWAIVITMVSGILAIGFSIIGVVVFGITTLESHSLSTSIVNTKTKLIATTSTLIIIGIILLGISLFYREVVFVNFLSDFNSASQN